jgi:hypothetical protein
MLCSALQLAAAAALNNRAATSRLPRPRGKEMINYVLQAGHNTYMLVPSATANARSLALTGLALPMMTRDLTGTNTRKTSSSPNF